MAVIAVGRRALAGGPRLVVLRALGLGDLLTAVPALRALRHSHPDHERTLVAPAALAPLVRLLDGAVDTVVPEDFRRRVGALPRLLAGADVAVNLHGRGPESHIALHALAPRRLIAFHHPDYAPDGPRWDPDEHERVRWARLLRESGITADPGDLRMPPPRMGVPAQFVGATLLHPGASAPARRWPVGRWAAVARHERDRGRAVVVTGNYDEIDVAQTVARAGGLDPRCVVAGRTDIVGLAALVAAAGRVACADTGVAHLASAFATPSVVVFGPTAPTLWGPPPYGRHVALWAGRAGDPHADLPDPGLLAIEVRDVTASLDRLAAADVGDAARSSV